MFAYTLWFFFYWNCKLPIDCELNPWFQWICLFHVWNSLARLCKTWICTIWVHVQHKLFASTMSVHCLGLSKLVIHRLHTKKCFNLIYFFLLFEKYKFKSLGLQRKTSGNGSRQQQNISIHKIVWHFGQSKSTEMWCLASLLWKA